MAAVPRPSRVAPGHRVDTSSPAAPRDAYHLQRKTSWATEIHSEETLQFQVCFLDCGPDFWPAAPYRQEATVTLTKKGLPLRYSPQRVHTGQPLPAPPACASRSCSVFNKSSAAHSLANYFHIL